MTHKITNTKSHHDCQSQPSKFDTTIDEIWAKEAEARLAAYERGEIKALTIEEVFGKYDKK